MMKLYARLALRLSAPKLHAPTESESPATGRSDIKNLRSELATAKASNEVFLRRSGAFLQRVRGRARF
ncbi:hypothetical protein SAMN05443245_3403 [Paraburkholderia fungorum]|uniref:Uncharacterized protein n=1 Tax=Paraburkholderia fungorum TaxID=134537 RepID=A0A1H1GZH3_9BURK|nr:hypothetical protein SAMN05443245_3403 [Paraburkholderia fungorum]